MQVTPEELLEISQNIINKHSLEAYGVASALHLAATLINLVQKTNKINLEEHIKIITKACELYAEIIGLEKNQLNLARLEIEKSAKTINFINTF